MTEKVSSTKRLFWILLAYGFIVTVWNIDYNTPYHDEVLNIQMGRQLLQGKPCPSGAWSDGTALIYPVLAAVGDAAGGIYGARAVGLLFGLGLTFVINRISRLFLSELHALLAATLFLFSGNVLYLFKLATDDIVAAFFLGLSFMLILEAEAKGALRSGALMLLGGSISLCLAAMTKYAVSVFIVPVAIFALLRQKPSRTLPFFVLPLLLSVTVYWYLAIHPAGEFISESIRDVYAERQVMHGSLVSWTVRWVALPYLLAFFGTMHTEKGRETIFLILMSLPVILLHLVTGDERSLNKNVIFSLIFLTPAAAVGVDQMGNLFTRNMPSGWVKPFFTFLLLLVVWAFGLQDLRWLERQYPDSSPVVSFFRAKGHDNMTVATDSENAGATYSYLLGDSFPGARFVSITEFEKEAIRNPFTVPPDFIVLNDYQEKGALREKALDCIRSGGYIQLRQFRTKLSLGEQTISIFARR